MKLQVVGNKLIVEYNEDGFTKDNVRAITAVGESTKKLLLTGKHESIGEKGIGFKSVFGVAKSVEIHSNGFDFILNGDQPTVPMKCSAKKGIVGTQMIYELKENALNDYFTEEKVIPLCLCLRKLKKLDINGISIQIYDEDKKRTISINGKDYELEKYRYDFEIDDVDAIKERTSDHESISGEQYVAYYALPRGLKLTNCNLYTGLPVSKVECHIPLIIDAPFELTTARDDVLQCLWNNLVKEAVYEGIIGLIDDKKYDIKLDVLKYVNYQKVGSENVIATFSSDYLNGFSWYRELRELEILPCLYEDNYIAPGREAFIVPDIIADVACIDKDYKFAGTVIDTRHKGKYKDLLEYLGCYFCDTEDQLTFISKKVDKYLSDNKMRDNLYKHLASIREDIEDEGYEELVPELPIFPVRYAKGTEYVKYTGNLYTHETQISSAEYLILDTNIMTYDLCQSILGAGIRINELSQEVFDAKYRDNLEGIIQSDNKSDKEVAEYLLHEFKYNRKALAKCIVSLKGLFDEIPMKMESGVYKRESKFSNKDDLIFVGNVIPMLCVSEEYREFAEFLECEDILKMHYSDIDFEMPDGITDEEIQDILDRFENALDILNGLIRDKVITDEQIAKFDLYFSGESSEDDDEEDEYEPFPGRKIKNPAQLKSHIEDIFYNNPNPYITKLIPQRKPKFTLNKAAYTDSMYLSTVNRNKCFCQMCRERTAINYIERNDVQAMPKYGWEQMYLSLCLKCSKDYVALRRVKSVWKSFIQEIMSTEIDMGDEVIEIDIGDRTISFTAVHLAEIKNILILESHDDRTFDDKGALIKDVDMANNPEELSHHDGEASSDVGGRRTTASIKKPSNNKWIVHGANNDFRTIPVTYSADNVSLNQESMVIDSDSIHLSLKDTVLFSAKSMDQYMVVRFVLKNNEHRSLELNARRVKVNGHEICERIAINIPDEKKDIQYITFAIPVDELPYIRGLHEINRISLYVEAIIDDSGNKTQLESEAVYFNTSGKIVDRRGLEKYK